MLFEIERFKNIAEFNTSGTLFFTKMKIEQFLEFLIKIVRMRRFRVVQSKY